MKVMIMPAVLACGLPRADDLCHNVIEIRHGARFAG